MKTLLRVATACAFLASVPLLEIACSWGCTEVGCSTELALRLSNLPSPATAAYPLKVHACVDALCTDFRIVGDATNPDGANFCEGTGDFECSSSDGALLADLYLNLSDESESQIAVEIRDANGAPVYESAVTRDVVAAYPNGSSCGVGCYTTSAAFVLP
jgi:hypothetical protein